MTKPVEAVLIGAGQRGANCYGPFALKNPGKFRFTGVVDPNEERRLRFAEAHGIAPERRFVAWEDLYAKGRIADAVVNCTQDRTHVDSTLPALELGYDALLEKPMSNSMRESVRLVDTAERLGRLLVICHVLRYTGFFSTLHDVLASGRLGDIITVEHRENVVFWHMAHSFVRGNWRNSELESPMILAKCCHDMDVLFWNLGRARRLSSFGSLKHYRSENAPSGAPKRCLDGCPVEEECEFHAPRLYLGENVNWPVSTVSEDPSLESRRQALETGPYGRCVYHCDNNVVDHQVVNFEFESGATASLFMHGHSHEEARTMRYDGTRATLRGQFGRDQTIEIHHHRSGTVENVPIRAAAGGHGGGDTGLMSSFAEAVRDHKAALTTAAESLESHLMAFAAEQARIEGTIIGMEKFRAEARAKA